MTASLTSGQLEMMAVPGEVLRRDRLTKDEGEQRCVPLLTNAHGQNTPATCTATSASQTSVGGNFDYNWDSVDSVTFSDPAPENVNNQVVDLPAVSKTSTKSR